MAVTFPRLLARVWHLVGASCCEAPTAHSLPACPALRTKPICSALRAQASQPQTRPAQAKQWMPLAQHEAECRALEERAEARLKKALAKCSQRGSEGVEAAAQKSKRLESQARAAEVERIELEGQLRACRAQAEEREARLAEAERRMAALKARSAGLEAQEARARQLEAEAERLRAELQEQCKRRDAMATELAECGTAKGKLHADLLQSTEQLAELRSLLGESRRQVVELQTRLARQQSLGGQLALQSRSGDHSGAPWRTPERAWELIELRERALSAREDALRARESDARSERGTRPGASPADLGAAEQASRWASLLAAEETLARHAKDVGGLVLWVGCCVAGGLGCRYGCQGACVLCHVVTCTTHRTTTSTSIVDLVCAWKSLTCSPSTRSHAALLIFCRAVARCHDRAFLAGAHVQMRSLRPGRHGAGVGPRLRPDEHHPVGQSARHHGTLPDVPGTSA